MILIYVVLFSWKHRAEREKRKERFFNVDWNGEKMRRRIKDEKYRKKLFFTSISSSEYSNDDSFDFKDWRMKIKYSSTVRSIIWKWSNDKIQSIFSRTVCSFQGHCSMWHWQFYLLIIGYSRLSGWNNPNWVRCAQRMFLIDWLMYEVLERVQYRKVVTLYAMMGKQGSTSLDGDLSW